MKATVDEINEFVHKDLIYETIYDRLELSKVSITFSAFVNYILNGDISKHIQKIVAGEFIEEKNYKKVSKNKDIIISEEEKFGFLMCSCNAWKMKNAMHKPQFKIPCEHILDYLKTERASEKSLKHYDSFINSKAIIANFENRLNSISKIFQK